MSYAYSTERSKLFTEEGQVMLLSVRDHVQRVLKQAGAIRMQEALATVSGETWTQMACVDRLVELGELREITNGNVPGQYRVFVGARE